MSDIEITRQDREARGRYVTVIEGHEAEMTYSRAGDSRIIIDYTGVPKALGGRGIGKALVKRAVEDARRDGIKIIPLCSFVKAVINKTPDWQDVLV